MMERLDANCKSTMGVLCSELGRDRYFQRQEYGICPSSYYEKKSAEGLRYMNIIGHVSKKMTAVIFAVMRDNKIYEPVLPTA